MARSNKNHRVKRHILIELPVEEQIASLCGGDAPADQMCIELLQRSRVRELGKCGARQIVPAKTAIADSK